jgi:hypothetical protein
MKEEKDLVEVPEFDAFTAFMKRTFDYVKENRKKVLIGAAVFFIILGLISAVPSFIKAKRENSFAELQKALNSVENYNDVKVLEIEKAFSVLNDKYSNSKASALGDIYMARAFHQIGEDDKAAFHYKKAYDFFGSSSLMGRLSMYELGCLYFDKSVENASNYFKPLAKTDSFMKEDALFYLALSGDTASLDKLKKDYPDGFYSEIVNEKINTINDLPEQ